MKYQGITIHKRKNCNTWYARYRHNGKQFYVSAKTQQDCYNKLKSALKQKTNQQIKLIEKPKFIKTTFSQWFNEWLETYKFNVTESTKKDYKSSYKKLTNLYKLDITQITNIDILKTLNKIELSRTRQKVYELLDMIFDKALLSEKISKNPMLTIEKPKHTRINGKPFTIQDELLFIKNCQEKNLDLFLIGLYQGLRHGELLAITDKDIDFESMTLNINKSLTQYGKFGKTKNHSDRIQPIFNKSAEILNKYKNVNGRIFKCCYKKADELFKQALTGLSNQNYTIKTLRFTFITKCQEANIPEHIIQKWVGHEIGSKVTKQVYTKIRESAENDCINIINNI